VYLQVINCREYVKKGFIVHEVSIVEQLMEIIESTARDADLERVLKVRVNIGLMRQVVPETLRFVFDTCKKDTIANDAEIEMVFVPICAVCESCKKEFTVEEMLFVCPSCSGVSLNIISGKELVLETMEGE
jgi:hydrogenase nickel incorporation protein HypA/HybF